MAGFAAFGHDADECLMALGTIVAKLGVGMKAVDRLAAVVNGR